MPSNLNKELIKIISTFSKNKNLNFIVDDQIVIESGAGELLRISPDKIISPINNLPETLYKKISPLPDQIPDYDLLDQLVGSLFANNSIKSLNHLGFCYHVSSQTDEREKLIKEINSSHFKLYEEPSNDDGKWYFIGDNNDSPQPMLEMVPVESKDLTFTDFWLPHIQIDFDTSLDENQIESLIYKIYDGDPKPFRALIIDDVVYVIRLRLGIIDGVNIFLDLATNHRGAERKKNIF